MPVSITAIAVQIAGFAPLIGRILLGYSLGVWAFFQLPLMLTGIHTALLIPYVLLYMAIAFPVSSFLQFVGLLKTGDDPITAALPANHLEDKIVLITGATTGIGLATAKRFLELGATVVMHGRSMERGRAAAKDLIKRLYKEGHGNVAARVVVMKGDLADLDDVGAFTAAFLREFGGRIDYLILNAGLAGFHARRTAQGHDLVLGVNYLSHFAIARALLPYLEATAQREYDVKDAFQPRVICLSSTLHQWSRTDPSFLLQEDLNNGVVPAAEEAMKKEEKKEKSGGNVWYRYLLKAIFERVSYPDSKLCQLFLAMEINALSKAYGGRVRAVAVNPGAVTSDIWRFFGKEVRAQYIDPVLSKTFISCPQAATPIVRAALTEPLPPNGSNAHYLSPYYVPFKGYLGGLPLFDLFSPFYGAQRVVPRLPYGAAAKATTLWRVGSRIVHPFLEKHGLLKVSLSWPPIRRMSGQVYVPSSTASPSRKNKKQEEEQQEEEEDVQLSEKEREEEEIKSSSSCSPDRKKEEEEKQLSSPSSSAHSFFPGPRALTRRASRSQQQKQEQNEVSPIKAQKSTP